MFIVFKFLLLILLLRIDIGGGFVQHENRIVSHYGSGQAHQLSLTNTEIRTAFGYFKIQTTGQIFNGGFKFHL